MTPIILLALFAGLPLAIIMGGSFATDRWSRNVQMHVLKHDLVRLSFALLLGIFAVAIALAAMP